MFSAKHSSPVTWADYYRRRMVVVDGAVTFAARSLHLFTYMFCIAVCILM